MRYKRLEAMSILDPIEPPSGSDELIHKVVVCTLLFGDGCLRLSKPFSRLRAHDWASDGESMSNIVSDELDKTLFQL